MGPDRLISYPPRLWEVDIVRASGAALAVCRMCGPLDRTGSTHQTLRAGVLSHLARHARRDLTPAHLRTCQCGRNGCPWHRRHRGCAGPVGLALTHNANSPTWQLADTCQQCCTAMPSTAAVPEPHRALTVHPDSTSVAPPAPAPDSRDLQPAPHDDSDYPQIWENADSTENPENAW